MTAHAVGTPSAVPVSPKGTPNTPAQGAAAGFEQQLHAARQRGGSASREQGAATQPHPQRDADPRPDRRSDMSPTRPDSRPSDSSAGRSDKGRVGASGATAAASTETSKPAVAANAQVPPASSTSAPSVVETLTDTAPEEAEPAAQDGDGNEQGAAALVGAMLALIGPAAGKVLAPAAAASPAHSGDPVAAAAGAPMLLQVGDAAAMAVTTSIASTAMPAQLLAADGLSLSPKSVRDPVRTDAASALILSAPPAAAHTAPVSVPIAAPAGSHAFAQELGQQVSWFVGQDVKHARIRLHPEELGSLDLKISVNHGRVDVVFHAQHPGAVTAVQQSLPQLDQMLAQHGLSLGNTEVGQHDRGEHAGNGSHGDGVAEIDEVQGPGLTTPVTRLGLLDAFA